MSNKGLWIKKITKEIKNKTHWAKLRVKKDEMSNKYYLDILAGRKNRRPHAHIGINLDQTLKFRRYRGITHSIEREVKFLKKRYGESRKVIIDHNLMPAKDVIVKLNIDGNTKEVTIREFRLE